MTDPFVHDDAAYVLGALSAEERAAFEAHLATCPNCKARVAEISHLPRLLAGMGEADLTVSAADAMPPDTLLPSVLRLARHERRRRRWIAASVAGAAAAAIVALSAALVSNGGGSHAPQPVAMTALVTTPVSATAQLQDVSGGTRIRLACHYASAYATELQYWLVVTDRSGATQTLGSWELSDGPTTDVERTTSLHRNQISSIEIKAGMTPILKLSL
jgi:anti-sigma-K factor RskA